MLNQVADGVWVRQSAWVWSNAIAVRGEGGLIMVDPGIDGSDLNQLADDVDRLGIPVVAGQAGHLPAEIPLPADLRMNRQQPHHRTLNQDRRVRVVTCWVHRHRPSDDPPVAPTCAFASHGVLRSEGRSADHCANPQT